MTGTEAIRAASGGIAGPLVLTVPLRDLPRWFLVTSDLTSRPRQGMSKRAKNALQGQIYGWVLRSTAPDLEKTPRAVLWLPYGALFGATPGDALCSADVADYPELRYLHGDELQPVPESDREEIAW